MQIAVGADHGGFRLKVLIVDFLSKLGHQVNDLGTESEDPVDYPDYAGKFLRPFFSRRLKGES